MCRQAHTGMSEGALARQRVVGTGQGFNSKVDKERLSSTGKAVVQGRYCNHLEPDLSKGKAERKVFWGVRRLNRG